MKNITHIRITRDKSRIKKVEVDDGYGKVIELPIMGFDYNHEAAGFGRINLGVEARRVTFYEERA